MRKWKKFMHCHSIGFLFSISLPWLWLPLLSRYLGCSFILLLFLNCRIFFHASLFWLCSAVPISISCQFMFSIKKCAPSSKFKAREWRRRAPTRKVRVINGKFFVILCVDDGIFFLITHSWVHLNCGNKSPNKEKNVDKILEIVEKISIESERRHTPNILLPDYLNMCASTTIFS